MRATLIETVGRGRPWLRSGFALLVSSLMVLACAAPGAMAVDDAYRPPSDTVTGGDGVDTYRAPRNDPAYRGGSSAESYRPYDGDRDRDRERRSDPGGYGEPYSDERNSASREERYEPGPPDDGGPGEYTRGGTYSQDEIVRAGHGFFGKVSGGLASAVEWAFHKAGRPNGYILGQDAGGAIVAGLRYGEGRLYTKDAGTHKVFWQGPSVGYDLGAEGSKVMTLVYNLRDPREIYERFGGVEGSAYLVGGVSVQLQKAGEVTLAPIRAGVGVRLGANVGYLKYTRSPTWNPF